jgi:hypothetical protein
MRVIVLFFIATLFGCKSVEKQRSRANSFFDKYPAELAAKCDKVFPVSDSAGHWESDLKLAARNTDYRQQIDSLATFSENILTQLIFSRSRVDSISEACADVVLSYMRDIDKLSMDLKRLSTQYTPCNTDTLRMYQTIYRRSTAHEAVLTDSIQQYRYQLSELTRQANEYISQIKSKDQALSEAKKDMKQWMWRAVGTWIGIALLLSVALYLLIRKK